MVSSLTLKPMKLQKLKMKRVSVYSGHFPAKPGDVIIPYMSERELELSAAGEELANLYAYVYVGDLVGCEKRVFLVAWGDRPRYDADAFELPMITINLDLRDASSYMRCKESLLITNWPDCA